MEIQAWGIKRFKEIQVLTDADIGWLFLCYKKQYILDIMQYK